MKKLASCFPNVIISPAAIGRQAIESHHYGCKKELRQNHDVIIKSPYEMVEIYKLLEGANDVEITPCPGDRVDQSRQWDARSLKLFRNESAMTPKQLNAQLTFAKGAAQASISRSAVEWLVNIANLTTLMNQLNEKQFGIDEILMESLQVSDDLDMPGRFTSECLMRGLNTPFISRMSVWVYEDAYRCKSKYSRKSICILGIEDLRALSQYPHLMVNKMLPEFDYSIVECVHEMIFNRTFLDQVDHALDSSYYSNMVNVKFNRNRKWPDPSYKLKCA
ncbi:Core-2/I-Branching enzyme [Ancylostoma caninum]|uniref:Core-2/I-Branching enzyme n=1 Tax=Ancylostoma caninum TaxID=29170 RepID=A0A368FFB6_ANCCA|nr:Core-2/I-Branching enzyme [Ancylostoma caninum]